MCTAISLLSSDHYFGRNLDYQYLSEEMITITPRNFPLKFRRKDTIEHHYAFMGLAYIEKNYPLYHEALNETGLSMAGLHFPEYTDYKPENSALDNITPFEFIPWVLGQCRTITDVRLLLDNTNLWYESFSEELPLIPLHWMISDSRKSIVIECIKEGIKVYDNPVGVMTNAPAFDIHLNHLRNITSIPGDYSSISRFIRASHIKQHTVHPTCESERVSHFFHILDSVELPKGCGHKYTVYSSCLNTSKGIYYYKTYNNSQITAIDMRRENLDSKYLISYPLIKDQQIRVQNR